MPQLLIVMITINPTRGIYSCQAKIKKIASANFLYYAVGYRAFPFVNGPFSQIRRQSRERRDWSGGIAFSADRTVQAFAQCRRYPWDSRKISHFWIGNLSVPLIELRMGVRQLSTIDQSQLNACHRTPIQRHPSIDRRKYHFRMEGKDLWQKKVR